MMDAEQAQIDAKRSAQRQVLETLSVLGAALVVGLSVFKATVPLIAFPAWDLDPMMMWSEVVGIGPTGTLAIDCFLLTLSGATMTLAAPLVGRARLVECFLLAAGILALIWHSFRSPLAVRENFSTGLAWTAALSAGLMLSYAGRLPSVRRVALAIATGFAALLFIKCAAQVLIDLPQTIADFDADRISILASHGWAPDSFAARTFERRLRDTSATGWFGLSNVVATFGAAFLGIFIAMLREPGAARRSVAGLGSLIAGACVVLAGSKGGYAAAAIAITIALLGPTASAGRPWRGALLLLSIPFAALAAVCARGLIGTRVGELSLLFRSQYLEAAARIFGQNPLRGVGPAGFRDAYLLAKNPLSPEEISSPHCIIFEFAATLGVGGVLWSVLWLVLLGSAGAGLAALQSTPSKTSLRPHIRTALFLIACIVLAGSIVEAPLATPGSGFARIVALALGAILAWRTCIAEPRTIAIASAAAAAALGFHAMIEVSPVIPASSALYFALLGLAAASLPPIPAPTRFTWPLTLPGMALSMLGIAASLFLGKVQPWEESLRAAASRLEDVSTLASQVQRVDAADVRAKQEIAKGLESVLSKPVKPDPASLGRAVLEARLARGDEAYRELLRAIALDPTSYETRQAASNLALRLGAIDLELGLPAGDHFQQGLMLAEESTSIPSRKAASYAWLASARRGVYEFGRQPALLRQALDASSQAAALDPTNPIHAQRSALLAAEIGDPAAARLWAERALTLDENMRLDPLRRLAAGELERLRTLAQHPPKP
ncbi:MAG: tetratricopeptide repeat protein [Phycisphaerales bacterium]|nr:tetratricopeptide repeat protein [Planctomycetota bacterium]